MWCLRIRITMLHIRQHPKEVTMEVRYLIAHPKGVAKDEDEAMLEYPLLGLFIAETAEDKKILMEFIIKMKEKR